MRKKITFPISCIEEFINRLVIDIYAQSYESLEETVIGKIASLFSCDKIEAELYYYNNALRAVKELATSEEEERRKISKRAFVSRINKRKRGHNMKRRISLLCCALLLFCTCVFNNNMVFANTREYNPDALKEVYELYNENETFLEILKKKESFSYRSIAAFYEENKFMNLATNVSAAILGQSVSEDEYVEMLSEIMTLNQYTISEQIAKYGSYNTTKGFVDFINDAADITFSLEDIVESFSFDDETVKFIYDSLKLGQKLDSKITEFDEITEDGKKYYQALVEDYAFSNQFLQAILENSNIVNLRTAAKKLMIANDSMFASQAFYVKKIVDDRLEFSVETFFDDIMGPAAEAAQKHTSDPEVKNMLKNIALLSEGTATFKTTFDLVIFIGNYTFGTSDTFAYLQKIKAIDEIASCVIGEVDKIDVGEIEDPVGQYKAILNKCVWYRWLITINGIGESYADTMVTNPNNSLVAIDDLIKMFTGELTAEEKYNQQLESLDRFDKTYVQPIFDIDVFASQKGNGSEGLDASVSDKAENARIINKYLDFVEQYEGEVFYSIQNIKEGKRPILLLAFSTDNAWDYEYIDDQSIYSSTCEVYDYIDEEIVQVGSMISFVDYLTLYTKEDNFYVAVRSNAHSFFFKCIRGDAMYSYGYNTNNIEQDTVQYEENGEYYNYAYGTTNYDDAISQYSKVEKVTFKRYAAEDRNAIEEGEGTQETSVSGENVTVKFDNWYEGSTEYGRLYGIDDAGNTLWEYTPKAGIAAELSHYIDIGRCKDRYYFNEDQIIYCFNVYTGEILWTNSDARFGVTMFDENGSGSLYVASWYENTLCIISSDGTTLAKIDNLKHDGLDSDSVPSSMKLVDNQTLEVTYWNGEVIYVDLSNYIRLG